jgi:hypothetical protein
MMEGEDLRGVLFGAIARTDGEELLRLCTAHADLILGSFSMWQRVPADIRADRGAMNAWGNALLAIARQMQILGHPELLTSLVGPAEDNPIKRWYGEYERARLLGGDGRLDEGCDLLLRILEESKRWRGSEVEKLGAKVYGLLGTNRFHAGELGDAMVWTELALTESRRIGDSDGVRAYRENLQVLRAVQLPSIDAAAGERLLRCRRLIVKAQDQSDVAHYERSNVMLQEALETIGSGSDEVLAEYRGKALGLLGWNHFQLHDAVRAREYTAQALDACRSAGDEDGVRIYSANLKTIDSK